MVKRRVFGFAAIVQFFPDPFCDLLRDLARVLPHHRRGPDVGTDEQVADERGALEVDAPDPRLVDVHGEAPCDVLRVGGHRLTVDQRH